MSARRALPVFSILLLVLVALGLVVVSPWALPALDQGQHANWGRLSQIGTTYGAISAVIAAIALTGVVTSLVLQRHEALVARRSAMRALHVDLMKLAMDDPVYMECWGEYVTENFDTERQLTYINLIISHWHAMYEVGECTDEILYSMATELFSGRPGRQFWKIAGSGRIRRAQNRKIRRFYEIIEKAYREDLTQLDTQSDDGEHRLQVPSSAPHVPVETSVPSPEVLRPNLRWSGLTIVAYGTTVLLMLAVVSRILRWIRAGFR